MIERLTLFLDRLRWEFAPRWSQCDKERPIAQDTFQCCVRGRGHSGKHRGYNGEWFEIKPPCKFDDPEDDIKW